MKASIVSAVLSTAVLANAASIPHGHAMHTHARRGAQVVKREPLQFLSLADASRLDAVQGFGGADAKPTDATSPQKVAPGKNVAASTGGPVVVGEGNPFEVELFNESEDDIIVVAWSNCNTDTPWQTANIASAQADVTHTLKANTSTVISFDPAQAKDKKISGAIAALYPDTKLNNGFVYNAWAEYTFTTDSVFSTTDVSLIPRMQDANPMEIHNYENKGDAEPRCSSTMTKCSFVCSDASLPFCTYGGIIQNCPVGTPYTTSSSDYQHGGCGGLRNDGGYIKVQFK